MVGASEDQASPERSSRDRKRKSKVISDPIYTNTTPPAVPMPPRATELPYRRRGVPFAMNPSANTRNFEQAQQEEDIVMVDGGGPSENLGSNGVKRSDSKAKKAAGFGGMFGGLLSKSRPDNKRRSTALTDDEGPRGLRREDRKIKRPAVDRPGGDTTDRDMTMSGGAAEEDQQARRVARRARRAEREAAEKEAEDARRAKEEERRERRRKDEERREIRRQQEKEARRAARREQKAQEEAARQATEEKEAIREERRRARRAEKDAAYTDAEPVTEDPGRLKKSGRRRSHIDTPAEDSEERRRKREERRAMRSGDTPRSSRRKSAPVVDDYFDPRNGSKSRPADDEFLAADGPVYQDSKRRKAGWPHSGTDSWVKDHSDAPPPPEDTPSAEGVGDGGMTDDNARRSSRKSHRRSKHDDDSEERRRRRESRRMDKDVGKSTEGSQGDGRRPSRRDSGYVDTTPSRAASASGGLFSRFKKIAGV